MGYRARRMDRWPAYGKAPKSASRNDNPRGAASSAGADAAVCTTYSSGYALLIENRARFAAGRGEGKLVGQSYSGGIHRMLFVTDSDRTSGALAFVIPR
jgi:hypothetical protein